MKRSRADPRSRSNRWSAWSGVAQAAEIFSTSEVGEEVDDLAALGEDSATTYSRPLARGWPRRPWPALARGRGPLRRETARRPDLRGPPQVLDELGVAAEAAEPDQLRDLVVVEGQLGKR